MENDKSQALSIKKSLLYRLPFASYAKKILRKLINLLLPRPTTKQLKLSLEAVQKENLLLSEIVNAFISTVGNNTNIASALLGNSESCKIAVDEIAGLLNWPEILNENKRCNGFNELIRLHNMFSSSDDNIDHSSNCWVLLAAKNCDQLLEHGYNNFKRTIGHNYFNFLVQKGDSQILAVESLFPQTVIETCRQAAHAMPHDPTFNTQEQFSYFYFIFLLWEYVKKIDRKHYLEQLEEPSEGNPLLVSLNGKNMSQDLANSLIEYYSMSEAVNFSSVKKILEIGGGYGRNAHVILSLNPKARIFLVDILPAIYIAQRYLSSIFPHRKVFKARNFSSFANIQNEIEESSIIFLLPHQLALIPDDYFDLSINISSFGEMKLEQIGWYFSQINRITRGHFYMKQWDASQNPFDDLILKKSDYPCPEQWKEIYSRQCVIQTDFFETIYQVN